MVPQARTIRMIGLLVMLSLAGCSTWFIGDYQDPDVRLVNIEVVKTRLLHQDFNLHFRVDNPNDASLPVRGLRYKVLLNGVLLAEGESSDWFIVDANSHRYFEIPVRTNLWQHLKYIAKVLKNHHQPVHYRLEGELKTGLLFGHSVHLTRNGEIIPGDFIPELPR